MTTKTVSVHASHQAVIDALNTIPATVEGQAGQSQLAQALLIRVGLVVLGRIKTAFIAKAQGGADESGLSWPPLSPKTIAYSRHHPGVPKKRPGSRPSFALSAMQKERWWNVYSRYLRIYRGDKGHAAAVAWSVLKREGAKTLMSQYGNTKVEILRDTGLLLNSLSPGSPSSVPHQIFRVGQGEVTIGTSRKGAAVQHNGTARIPQRRLWPDPANWPASWWLDVTEAARLSIIDIATELLKART